MPSNHQYKLVTVHNRHVKLPARGLHVAHLNYFDSPRNFSKRTAYTAQRLQITNRNVRLDKSVKSVITLLDETSYVCVSTRRPCVIERWRSLSDCVTTALLQRMRYVLRKLSGLLRPVAAGMFFFRLIYCCVFISIP
jgi:hypothetical protein